MADGAGRGRPAVDVELVLVAAVGAQVGAEDAAVAAVSPAASRADERPRRRRRRRGRRCARSVQSRMREKVSAPITSARFAWPALIIASAVVEREDEAGADRLDVEGGAVVHAELRLHRHGGGRERCGRASPSRARSGRCRPRDRPASASAARAACSAEVGGQLARRRRCGARLMPVRCDDPLVRRVDHLRRGRRW